MQGERQAEDLWSRTAILCRRVEGNIKGHLQRIFK